jgi:hypothetical protein
LKRVAGLDQSLAKDRYYMLTLYKLKQVIIWWGQVLWLLSNFTVWHFWLFIHSCSLVSRGCSPPVLSRSVFKCTYGHDLL